MLSCVAVCVALLCVSNCAGQPVSCADDVHCSEGYFCEVDAHICRECLRCQDLKRNPPSKTSVDQCVKSVTKCGDCYEGLELDRRRGDVNAECVPISASAATTREPEGTPEPEGASQTWLYVIVALVVAALVIVCVIVLLLRRDIFKPTGSGRNSVTATITATAPEAPPPYHTIPTDTPVNYYSSQGHTNGHAGNGHASNGHYGPCEEDQHPFIVKSAPRGGEPREAAGSQAARVYEDPIYLRENQPPSPASSPVSDTDDTSFLHNDETTASVWTPVDTTPHGDNHISMVTEVTEPGPVSVGGAGDVGALSLQLAAARHTDLVDASPAKKMRLQQDTNNNRNRETNSGSDSSESCPRPPSPQAGHAGHGPHAAHGPGGPPYNFTTQIINVVQFNANK